MEGHHRSNALRDIGLTEGDGPRKHGADDSGGGSKILEHVRLLGFRAVAFV